MTADSKVVRALPPRPGLEFERKEAKKLLRQLRRGDPDALNRARVPRQPAEFKLADAQLAIAREYGFLSWPKLVRYYETLARHERSLPRVQYGPDFFEGWPKSILREHRDGRPGIGEMIATFVPRFYGKSAADVMASEVTEDEARLVVAREYGCPSWEVLMERAAAQPERRNDWANFATPLARAGKAIRLGDLETVKGLVAQHPELLSPTADDDAMGATLAHTAIRCEMKQPSPETSQISAWLRAQGLELDRTLNQQLLGRPWTTTEEVARLLRHGADPNWMPPNGITVLEHAICRYLNPDAVDVIARRVEPRKAFWIAAGLGDVASVSRYIDRRGAPTNAARRHRPDFNAIGPHPMPALPDAADVEIVGEAFYVATINRRFDVLDLLLDRGFPVDYRIGGMTMIRLAIGNGWDSLVEYLIRRGADLDQVGWRPQASARDMAAWRLLNDASDAASRRIVELCGGDPDAMLDAYDRQSVPPSISPRLQTVIDLGREEASRAGQSSVESDNLFVALLRGDSLGLGFLVAAGADVDLLHRAVGNRLRPVDGPTPVTEVSLAPSAHDAVEAAIESARKHRRKSVEPHNLLYALVLADTGDIADLLAKAKTTPGRVREQIERGL